MPTKSAQIRSYQKHGHTSLSIALKTISSEDGWLEKLGPVGDALQAWKQALIEDLGGQDEVSAMELSVIELATKTHLLLSSVDKFLLAQPSLINKSKRTLFAVVLQRQTLADALAAYMKQLGMKKQRKPPATLSDYLTTKQTTPPTKDTATGTE